MGGLAAASGFGQTLGSAAGRWLFGVLAQRTFGWLTLPLLVVVVLVLVRPGWWSITTKAREMLLDCLSDKESSTDQAARLSSNGATRRSVYGSTS